MRNFKRAVSIIISLLILVSAVAISAASVSAASIPGYTDVYCETFESTETGAGKLPEGWSFEDDSSKNAWEIAEHKDATGYADKALHYKGGSKNATVFSSSFNVSNASSTRFYLLLGVKSGQKIDSNNTLKISVVSGKNVTSAFNLSTGDDQYKYKHYGTETAAIKSWYFDFDPYIKDKKDVKLKITALGNVEFFIGTVQLVKPGSSESSGSSSGSSSGTSSGGSSSTSSGSTQTTPGENGAQSITKINLNLSDPKVNTTQPTQVSGTGFTGTISWTPSEVFIGGKQYVADVTLNASNGYEFSKDAQVTVPSSTPANLKITSSKITFSLTYVPESTSIKITKISYDYITRTTAQLVMETSGSEEIIEKYFEYGTQIGNYTGKSLDGALTDLTSNTIYYYRAVVVTSAGQIMSEPSSFKTNTGLTIVTKASSGGTVTPFGSSEVATGDTLTVTVTPNDGYVINFVTVDEEDIELGEDGTYTFSNINADHVLYAAFKPAPTSADSESDGGSGFVKFLIIFIAIILAAAILIFLLKPKGMGFGDLCAAGIIKVRRWNYRRKMAKRRPAASSRSRNVQDDYYDDDEYGYDDDDFDDDLPVLGQNEQRPVTRNDSYGYDDEFSSKYDFDKFK